MKEKRNPEVRAIILTDMNPIDYNIYLMDMMFIGLLH